MKKILLAIILSPMVAWAACPGKTVFGPPTAIPYRDLEVRCRIEYEIAYSPALRSAIWSAEQVTAQKVTTPNVRLDKFKQDPDLKSADVPHPSVYEGSGYDKGHLTPFDDIGGNAAAGLESFYMSNIVPQHPKNNRVGWKSLEIKIRKWAVQRSSLYVITGPIYNQPVTLIKQSAPIPSHLYKIVVDPVRKELLVIMVPNAPITSADLPKYVTELSTVEQYTGIKFFPKLPKDITLSKKLWD